MCSKLVQAFDGCHGVFERDRDDIKSGICNLSDNSVFRVLVQTKDKGPFPVEEGHPVVVDPHLLAVGPEEDQRKSSKDPKKFRV